MPLTRPYVKGLTAPCPRCEKLTIAKEALIDDDLTVYILFKCLACGEPWEVEIPYESFAIKEREEGEEPSP